MPYGHGCRDCAENTPTPNTHHLPLSFYHWGLGSLTKAQLALEQWFPTFSWPCPTKASLKS